MRRSLLPDPLPRAQLDASLAIVNIVLLLLFFFLATGRLLSGDDTTANISETTRLRIDSLPRPVLQIEGDGTLVLDGSTVSADVLSVAVAGETTLHVLIDRDEPATALIDVLADPGLSHMELKLVTIHTGMAMGAP